MTALQPGRYRPKFPPVEAVRLTADNIDEVAELVGGRVIREPNSPPRIRMPHSIKALEVGDYARRESPEQPWHPILAIFFEPAHELCCEHCGR